MEVVPCQQMIRKKKLKVCNIMIIKYESFINCNTLYRSINFLNEQLNQFKRQKRILVCAKNVHCRDTLKTADGGLKSGKFQ